MRVNFLGAVVFLGRLTESQRHRRLGRPGKRLLDLLQHQLRFRRTRDIWVQGKRLLERLLCAELVLSRHLAPSAHQVRLGVIGVVLEVLVDLLLCREAVTRFAVLLGLAQRALCENGAARGPNQGRCEEAEDSGAQTVSVWQALHQLHLLREGARPHSTEAPNAGADRVSRPRRTGGVGGRANASRCLLRNDATETWPAVSAKDAC
ncbi:MAG: hypothetical protein COW34_03425 [Armatimonadetes bacterium CG17_big_fil_post_rev_8_21_14_2_50_66_6]|nr:MAG: hypothetical protein COW34_03425 [Armatimonadetes bacterium CG17_big_fil_post_rev_8_21_14_2_50_66_6]